MARRLSLLLAVAVVVCDGFHVPKATPRPALRPLRAEATFGMGCFWKPAEELRKIDGVEETIAGYTGNPSNTKPVNYENVCFNREWVEGVRVVYDEQTLSYDKLLDAFFEAQEPRAGSRQYGSMIFPHDENQRAAALDWLEKNKDRVRRDGVPASFTQVEALSPFFQAESYHQNYWNKMRLKGGAIVTLLTVSSGVLDSYTPLDLHSSIHTAADALALTGLCLIILERKVNTKTVEL